MLGQFFRKINPSWSRGSVPSSHARGQRFEPRRRQYFKLLLDLGDFHSNPSGLLSFNKSETVLWTIAKICIEYYKYYKDFEPNVERLHDSCNNLNKATAVLHL